MTSAEPIVVRQVSGAAGYRVFVRNLSARVFRHFGEYDRMLPAIMPLPHIRTVVAEIAGEPVGFAMYSREGPAGGEIDLIAIAVSPEWQSRGVGRRLLAYVESEARRLLVDEPSAAVRLTVAEDNARARALFEGFGFASIPGEVGTYPGGQPSISLRKPVGPERPPAE